MNIKDIKVYDKNAKIHTEEQLNKIADSIKKFGFDQAVVIDKKGVIIIGHGRFLAAKNILKWTEIKVGVSFAKKGDKFIPIVKREDLSDLEVKVRRVNDNKLNESAWDVPMLTTELIEITQSENYEDLSIDIKNTDDVSLTGFSKDLLLTEDDFGTEFSLPDGDKSPFQQITFTLADAQANEIKEVINKVKKRKGFDSLEKMGNDNGNGNALYLIIKEWKKIHS